ncbi:MAG: aminotransferase class I/II-fold pyridoxal phosphate-dependent enzyme [Bacillota bacterium]|nr:aminotransferase class I/II-fold pyridoxal phosphate-dependent enzyme [Bacillota bacterium]
MYRVPLALPDLDDTDIEAVFEVLRSGRLALGLRALEFERIVAEYVGVQHAVAVSSGTAALHLIVRALGIGPGDEVLVPSFTFAASVNAVLYEGATPVFVDIEPETYNIDPGDLERKITPRAKAIMAVDIFGRSGSVARAGSCPSRKRSPGGRWPYPSTTIFPEPKWSWWWTPWPAPWKRLLNEECLWAGGPSYVIIAVPLKRG